MKIEEQVLSIEQMKHLQELGVDTSDASLAWFMSPNTNQWKIKIKDKFAHEMLRRISPERYIPTYTIGDLIEKLPKHFNTKEEQISMVAINGSGAFEVWYDEVPKSNKRDGTIKNALYKLLCWVAEKHKELLEVRNEKENFT